VATLAFGGLAKRSGEEEGSTYRNQVRGYGDLVRDPAGLLDLPPGFNYRVISSAGSVKSEAGILIAAAVTFDAKD
jgi:hypothetical protein